MDLAPEVEVGVLEALERLVEEGAVDQHVDAAQLGRGRRRQPGAGSASVTSVGTVSAVPPPASISPATSFRYDSVRAASTTRAPSRANACAIAWPRPGPIPDTIATLPSTSTFAPPWVRVFERAERYRSWASAASTTGDGVRRHGTRGSRGTTAAVPTPGPPPFAGSSPAPRRSSPTSTRSSPSATPRAASSTRARPPRRCSATGPTSSCGWARSLALVHADDTARVHSALPAGADRRGHHRRHGVPGPAPQQRHDVAARGERSPACCTTPASRA